MTVVLGEPTPFYLELEPLGGSGSNDPPRMRVTIYNIPATAFIELRRSCEGESWPVPGARNVAVTDTAVFTDHACPLNRTVTYTVLVDGAAVASQSAVLPSDASWLQDPLRPDGALPVRSVLAEGCLQLAQGALSSGTYSAEGSQIRVMGDKYPRTVGGQRQAVTDVGLPVLCMDEATSEALEDMADSPVLLFRPMGKLRPLPALAYLAAEVTEEPLDQHNGGAFARWNVTGNLVAAVVQAAVTGQVTYGQVQELLGQYTYGQVQAMAASTIYLDWLKDPLIFASLSAAPA